MRIGQAAWPRRTGAFCALVAAAWALAQGPADPETPPVPGNREPVLIASAPGGELAVRAGERATLIVEALDPDISIAGAPEAVWLSAAWKPGAGVPDWLGETLWASGPSPDARLEIGLAPPAAAAPGRYAIEVGATDARGLTSLETYTVRVLEPLCGALAYAEAGVCRRCADNHVPDAARTGCEPCPAGTERPAGSTACVACAPGLVSDVGAACVCGPAQRLQDGVCVDCPPHTETRADGAGCVACPLDTQRPAGAATCTDCPAGAASAGGAACAAAVVGAKDAAAGGLTRKSARATDTIAPSIAEAVYADDTVTLTLSEPVWAESAPAFGDFTLSVTDDGSPVTVTVTAVTVASLAAEASATMTLTLSAALGGSATVSLTYTANADAALRPRDAAGNRLGTQTVTVSALRTLTVSFDGLDPLELAEGADKVRATLTLDNPPDSGKYTGCGLRLAAASVADAADVGFLSTDKELNPGNHWSVDNAKLLRIVDDGLAEGDEALVVEGFCTGGDAGMAPAAADLVSAPAAVALVDDESLTVTLTVDPEELEETASATAVTVTATLDGEATAELELPLSLSGTAPGSDYTVTGTRSVTITVGATGGTTVLTVTPAADDDEDDETIAIGATLSGYAVTGTTLTIAEPAEVAIVASLVNVDPDTLAENAGQVTVRLALDPKPTRGTYTGCRVRLAPDSVAETPADVTFSNQKKLNAGNEYAAQAGFLTVVDDTLAEGDEALVVEGYCASSRNQADPPHTELISRPLTLTIADNDQLRPLTLSVTPDWIGETLGEQTVKVTATLDSGADEPVTVTLSLGTGSYTVTGTQRIEIAAEATSGTTTLVFEPADDSNTTDNAVTIGGTAPGYTVTGTSLTIEEPTMVGPVDLSRLGVALSVSPAAIGEDRSGDHRVTATLTGAPVPTADVAMVLSIGGTATEGTSHDYTLTGETDWKELTVAANDAHLTADTSVTVETYADALDEGEETVTFTVSRVTWDTTVVMLKTPATATLRITDAWATPEAPTGVTAAPAAGDERHGLDVGWEAVTATPPVRNYTVGYREVAAPPAMGNTSDAQPGLSATVVGLTAGTRHEVRVRAHNLAGAGAESGSVYAYTADGACAVNAPRVTTPTDTRSATELEVSWQAPVCEPSIAGYLVRYREDPTIEGVTNDWLNATVSGLTATLVSLTADTAYVVQVRAVETGGDRGGWSPAGKGRTALDPRLPPRVGAPAVAAHADYGDERLDATWTRVTWVDGNNVAQPITAYQYRYRTDGGTWTAATDATARASETATLTRTLAGLESGTWYQIQVRGVNRMDGIAYPGKWSEPGRGRTWGVPDRVEEPSAYLTGTAVIVIWDPPDDGGSPITDYDVQYKTRDSGGWEPHPYAGCGVGSCETMISIPALAKKVRVRAENAVGRGVWSQTAKVQARKLLRVSYSQARATVAEGELLTVTVRLDNTADRPVTVPLTTLGGAGSFRLDGAANNQVLIGLGRQEKAFQLAALPDADNDDETVTLGFGQLPDGVLRTAPASLVVTIDDDEASNGKPTFDEGAVTTRAVAENTAANGEVGSAVAATDPDDDALTYTLTGTDAGLFTIDSGTGQIRVGSGLELNFEGAVRSYALTVHVSDEKDSAGEADPAVDASIAVTVEVSDVDEPPSAPNAPRLTADETTIEVDWDPPENAGPRITDYDVRYRASGDADWTDALFEGTGTETTLIGLAVGAVYEVRIKATNDEGMGGWSDSSFANTLPRVTLSASTLKPEIAAGNAEVPVTLTGTAEIAGGDMLTGAWLLRDGNGAIEELKQEPILESGMSVTHRVLSAAPGAVTYGFRVSYTQEGRTNPPPHWIDIEWRPSMVLDAQPMQVTETDGAQTVTVTAALTGTVFSNLEKTVTVSVAGDGATVVDDFAAVADFDITIPGGAGRATGTFVLTPVADAFDDEGAETVSVTGTATDGQAMTVHGTTVTIDKAGNRKPTFDEQPPATRTVAENTGAGEPVGLPVTATDPDEDALIYALDPGETRFAIDRETGQINVGSDTVLDFEGAATSYELTVHMGDGKASDGAAEVIANVDASIAVTVEVLDVDEPPPAPDAPRLTAGETTIEVDWDPPENTGWPPITDYDVRYRASGETDWTDAGFEGTGARTTLSNLALGTVYEVRVNATNDEGMGGWSVSSFENTLPRVTLSASTLKPEIAAGNAEVPVTLTGTAEIAGGDTLTGAWLLRDGNGTIEELKQEPILESGMSVTHRVSAAAPGAVTYGFRVSYTQEGRTNPPPQWIDIEWRPSVVLDAQPMQVTETDGAQPVTVTAALTGTAFSNLRKTVTVTVAGDSAITGDDFAAVDDFDITIPADTRSAMGTFVLTPVGDALDDEGPETVSITGTATDGQAITVAGTTVTISDTRPELTVIKPENGYVTGTDANQATVIDCGSGGRSDCTEMPASGTVVTLTATADEDHGFGGWTGECTGTGNCTLTVDADTTVGATFVALPGKPAAPAAMPTDDTTLIVSWTAPAETDSGIVDYGLRHSPAGAQNWTPRRIGGPDTTATIRGLSAGTRYDIQVQAVAAEGAGMWSDSVQAVTLPTVSVEADTLFPAIGENDALAPATVTARATAAEGALTGRWVRRTDGELRTVEGGEFTMTSGQHYTATFRFDSPGTRTYGLRVTHGPNSAKGEVGKLLDIQWLPSVVLSAHPTSVIEDGGSQTVTVTATLTGTEVEDVSKTVSVQVAGGTATAGDDFEPVTDFTIEVPGGARSASRTFDLRPVADTVIEGDETVTVGGAVAQGGVALRLLGTTLAIANSVRHRLTVTAPTHGRLTGNGIDCGGTGGTPQWTDCEATYGHGASVTLTALADTGYLFGGWTGDCSGTGNCTLTMDANKSVGATFGVARTLTVNAPTNGTITGKIGTAPVIDCPGDCTETVAHGTTVALTASGTGNYGFGSWGEDCAAETSSGCSVTLDADKTVSVTFVVTSTDGVCDESRANGCAAGTLNRTAFVDDGNYHRWRCDGINGGADSRECMKAKAGCEAGSRDWSVGGFACSGSVSATTSGQTSTATDSGTSPNGSATFRCDDGAWIEQSGSTCESCTPVNGGWLTTYGDWSACSATACGQSGTRSRSWSRTCTKPMPSCGGTDCSGPTSGAENKSCVGYTCPTDRTCSAGVCRQACDEVPNQPWEECSGPLAGADHGRTVRATDYSYVPAGGWADFRCNDGAWVGPTDSACVVACDTTTIDLCEVTRTGSFDSNGRCTANATGPCSYWCNDGTWMPTRNDCVCDSGYEEYQGSCVAQCGTNEERNANGNCVCKAGFHRYNGSCVENPMCSDPLVEDTCKAPATYMHVEDTVVNGICHATAVNKCSPGTFEPAPDTPKVDGRCGTATNACSAGTSTNRRMETGKNLWDCQGIGGSSNWNCNGTDGSKNWKCTHGSQSQPCSIDEIMGTDKSCSKPIAALDDPDCFSCKAGYEEYQGSCVTQCGTNEERNANGNCVCKAGFHRYNGSCVENPMCSDPLVEDTCKAPATYMHVEDTVVNGICHATAVNKCSPGTFEPAPDTPKVDGRCGTATNACSAGTSTNRRMETGKNLWDCQGIGGSSNWNCNGTDGSKNWKCTHGSQSQPCSIDEIMGTDKSCSKPIAALDYLNCFSCKAGYEECGGDCVAACGVNELLDSNCNCVCETGYERVNGACVELLTLTVRIVPPKGRVTGSGIDCPGVCSTTVLKNQEIALSANSNSGYDCEFEGWRTTHSFTMQQNTVVTVNCPRILGAEAGGPYDATQVLVPVPTVGHISHYYVNVSASATGGVPAYTFMWEGRSTGSTAIYIFVTANTYRKNVTVTDQRPNKSATDRAEIYAGTSGSRSDGGEAVSFEVPLGGELYFVWGEEGSVTARSGDTGVGGVGVSSPAIRVTGVGVGETDVFVQTDAGELRLPVVVK